MGKEKAHGKSKRSRSCSDDENDGRARKKSSSVDDENRGKKSHKERRRKKSSGKKSGKRRRRSESSSSDSASYSSSDSSSSDSRDQCGKPKKVINQRLLAKLQARGETLEERNARRSQKRAALISQKFGYTPEENPFNDPNLHEKFTWKKKEEKVSKKTQLSHVKGDDTLLEIEKVRKRRQERELQYEEMERIRAEESRMKELENYDEWARKEEEFHLQQQRQRSAIRLVEGREKPVDILAKNLLLFGLSDEEKENRARVKYQEKYNAMEALETLEAELDEPQQLLKMLKLHELEELRADIDAFRVLEREASNCSGGSIELGEANPALRYWDALATVVDDEIAFMKTGGAQGTHARMVEDVQKIFEGQSIGSLIKMKSEVITKLERFASDVDFDRQYWMSVAGQLDVFLAKATLSDQHSKMLVRQLEKLEKKREELSQQPERTMDQGKVDDSREEVVSEQQIHASLENGDLEEELGITDEIGLVAKTYSWQDKYRPRKPRYFNRVKTGYDWNKYNQTHYDKDNPPPKIVQGYKFNIFYTDLIDQTKTPTFTLEPADSDEFCIIRFRAGAPYEDIAFKIINREWNRSRKRGFKCTFERGVLSLYFNFATHWYRR